MPKIDSINKCLSAAQSIAIIGGVVVALVQLDEIRDQDYRQAQIASATLVLKFRDQLAEREYSDITSAIQDHDENYPILLVREKGGKFKAIFPLTNPQLFCRIATS